MSQDSIDIVRRGYAAYNDRDIEAIKDLWHEDCSVYTLVEGQAEPEPFRGLDGIRTWIENENEVWESVRIEELELRDAGNNRVFTSAVAHVRGKGSGIELSTPVWTAIEVRDGKLFLLRSYSTPAEALAAVALAE